MLMKNKYNLLFAFLYFASILIGHLAYLFNPLLDNIYYGQIVYLLGNVARAIIYAILIVTLYFISKKFFKEEAAIKEKHELTLKKAVILYLITLLFITLVSILAGWQLKPLSDLGEKYTGLKIWDKLTDLGVLAIEIYMMMKMYEHFDKFYVSNSFKNFKHFSLSIIFVLLTFSVYRLIVDFTIYQIIFIPFTILLGFIYPYTEKSFLKTYLIALLVFLF